MTINSFLLQPYRPELTNFVHLEPHGGARRSRTADLLRARQALSQLSYGPMRCTFHAILALGIVLKLSRKSALIPGPKFQNFADWSIAVAKHIKNMRVAVIGRAARFWWVWEDLNFRPHPYQGCALTN